MQMSVESGKSRVLSSWKSRITIHTSWLTRQWFINNNITLLVGWPPYSPDLNPIEHLWPRLKELFYEVLPELDLIQGRQNQVEAMKTALPEAWRRIPARTRTACIASMPRRLQAVIDAEGWQTRY